MLHATGDFDFDKETSEINFGKNCLNFPKFQMPPRQNLFHQLYGGI